MRTAYSLLFLCWTVALSAQVSTTELPLMNEYRFNHQAASLGDSRALAAGGWNQNEVLNSAEVYDQLLEIWDFTDPMSVPRTNFTMCDLNANYVIAAGGWDGATSNHASTEIYDYEDQMWMVGPDLSVGRSNLKSTKLLDGRVLFTGGYDGTVDQAAADIYDPITNTMAAASTMASARSSHASVLLQNGSVMVIGGFNPDLNFQMTECEIYDPFLDEWTSVAPMNIGRDNLAATVLQNGDVLVTGGRMFNGDLNLFEGQVVAEIYSIENNTWTELTTQQGQSYHQLHAFGSAVFSIAGADNTGSGVTVTYSETQEFNQTGLEGAFDENTDVNRYRYASCQLGTGVLVCGGDEEMVGSASWWNAASSVSETPADQFMVYPNPAIDNVFINGPNLDYWRMYDMKGNLVLEGKTTIFSVSSLQTGRYILEIHHADFTSRQGLQRIKQ